MAIASMVHLFHDDILPPARFRWGPLFVGRGEYFRLENILGGGCGVWQL